jgi:pyruvate,water dikinase
MRGTGISAGRAQGPVRLLGGDADLAALRPGEVAVCATLPRSESGLDHVCAIVVETGGVGSAALQWVRARRLPAVRLQCARERLLDGVVVEVDGENGTVVVT